MKLNVKWSLGVKLGIVFSSLITVTATTLILFGYWTGKGFLTKESTARFNSIATNLAFNAEYGVLTKNSPILKKIVEGVRREKDVNYVEITDRTGSVLAQMGSRKEPASLVIQPVRTKKADLKEEGGFLFEAEPDASQPAEAVENPAEMEEIGQVHVEFDLSPMEERLSKLRYRFILLALIFIVACVFLTQLVVRWLIAPLNRAVAALSEIAAGGGNLAKKLEVTSEDEVGALGRNFNRFTDTLAGIILSVRATSNQVSTSAGKLTAVSKDMALSARQTSTQANAVSASVEQVNRNIQSVASGTEEMSASLKEIAKNVSEAAQVATSAVRVAESTNQKVSKLGDSSAEIGNIIKVISSIAEQTNLLALNATIEAARAGGAGKGFAVVANEVKDLAKETARSTEDIRRKVELIQTDTKGAVEAIAHITAIINQINDIQNSIAGAVEEQTRTTSEITLNLAQAAKGSSEIAQNVTNVAQATQNTSSGASDTQKAAVELSDMADQLQRLVEQFK